MNELLIDYGYKYYSFQIKKMLFCQNTAYV